MNRRLVHNRVTRKMAHLAHDKSGALKRAGQRAAQNVRFAGDTAHVARSYGHKLFPVHQITRRPDVNLAVVLHLYYVDMWPIFVEMLKALDDHPFDLFITLRQKDAAFAEEIKKAYKDAYVFPTPNRGRDVLPFMMLAPHLDRAGYEYLLKFHSKKSKHRTDGDQWFTGIIDRLVPAKRSVIDQVIKALEDPRTGIIGPKGEYLSLLVNFPANHPYVVKIMSRIYGRELGEHIAAHKEDYGFMAGTMFWARLDALRPVLRQGFKVYHYDPETGQVDATFAHALERVFTLVAEMDKRQLYEVSNQGVTKISTYKTDNIPDWSDVYVGVPAKKPRD